MTEVSQRHTELSSFSFAHDTEYGLGPYSRLYLHRKEDWGWYRGNPDLPKWELIEPL
jgi:hypothetical protein